MKRCIITGLALIMSLFSIGNKTAAQRIPNSIEIHDNQYACYNSTEYFIIDSTISIYGYSEEGEMYDSGYTDEVYLDTTLSKTQLHTLYYFMEHFPFDSLKDEYKSGINKNCDSLRQIHVEINWKSRKKEIQVYDCYNKDVGMLFDAINMLIPKNNPRNPDYNSEILKFDYEPEQFQCQK
jgi:hypothetical protein